MRSEFKSLGFSVALIVLNVFLMAVLAFTPAADVLDYVFSYMILGVLFFGAILTGGVFLARKGIRNRSYGLAAFGVLILQAAYGIFGAGVLGMVPASLFPAALGITLTLTTGIALVAGMLVYLTGRDFSNWGRYANYLFLGVVGVAFFGTFLPAFGLIAFTLALAGFFVYLVYEIYRMRSESVDPYLNGIGIYVAFMGVFVEILQLVVRMFLEE